MRVTVSINQLGQTVLLKRPIYFGAVTPAIKWRREPSRVDSLSLSTV
jgi:hypothetical protein